MLFLNHGVKWGRECKRFAQFDSIFKLIELVLVDRHSLCAESSVAFSKGSELCSKLLGPGISGIYELILESLLLFDIDGEGQLVAGHGVQFCSAHFQVWIGESQAELCLRETDESICLMHNPEVVAQS